MGYVNLLNVIYPVGSVYFSTNSTSPSTIIGGTWTQITDKFIKGNKDITSGGSYGHTHSVSGHARLHVNSYGVYWTPSAISANGNHYTSQFCRFNGSTENGSVGHVQMCAAVGTAASTNINPPYQNMYIWYRVS